MRILAWSVCCGIALALTALLPVQTQGQQKKQSLEGIWLGPLLTGGPEMRIAFHITAKDGKLSATMDSLDQNAKGIPVAEVTVKDGAVTFDVKVAKVVVEGKLNKEETEIVATWKQGGVSVPLTLKRVDKLPVANRPQEPKRPFPYREEDVVYENKKANIKLAGTLTLPKGTGPFPVALLITGSGAQNRDEEIFGHKPFMLIADYLTRRGIAVLRVDDRGVGGSTGSFATATTVDFAGDVETGIEFLKAHKEIDAKRIGLIGHSEGGIIGPMLAARSQDVAFIVMLAGSGYDGERILMEQNKLLMEAAGADKAAVDLQLKLLALVIPIVKKETDIKVAEKQIVAGIAKWQEKATEDEKKLMKDLEPAAKKALAALHNPWFRFFLSHDPAPDLRKVQCPVLALIGEKDLQVPCKSNLEAIGKALKEGGNKDFTIKDFPKLNHLFQTCKTGAVTEYATIEETMAPVVLQTMAEWIEARTKK